MDSLKESFLKLYLSSETLKQKYPSRDYHFYINSSDTPGSRARDVINSDKITKDYLVCEKTDGVRNLLFSHNSVSYLVDRAWNFKQIPIKLPDKCILDGEFIELEPEVVGEKIPFFVIFDVIFFNGVDIGAIENLQQRLSIIDKMVDKMVENNQFSVKQFYETKDTHKLKMEKIYKIGYKSTKCDGIIFTPRDISYYDIFALKWKPVEYRTIDFMIDTFDLKDAKCCENGLYSIPVSIGKLNKFGVKYHAYGITNAEIDNLNTKQRYLVIECAFINHKWTLQKIRIDKQRSNSLNVAWSILENIHSVKTFENLKELIDC